MSITHTIRQAWLRGQDKIEKDVAYAAGNETNLDEVVVDAATDFLININLDVDKLSLIYIESDQDVTLETNDGTTPQESFSLLANKPLVWHSGSHLANPFSGDITAFYFTNASGSNANIKVRALQDPSP